MWSVSVGHALLENFAAYCLTSQHNRADGGGDDHSAEDDDEWSYLLASIHVWLVKFKQNIVQFAVNWLTELKPFSMDELTEIQYKYKKIP